MNNLLKRPRHNRPNNRVNRTYHSHSHANNRSHDETIEGHLNEDKRLDYRPPRNRVTLQQYVEKFTAQARDAASSGDRVLSENYLQHADHFTRLLNEQKVVRQQIEQKKQHTERQQVNEQEYQAERLQGNEMQQTDQRQTTEPRLQQEFSQPNERQNHPERRQSNERGPHHRVERKNIQENAVIEDQVHSGVPAPIEVKPKEIEKVEKERSDQEPVLQNKEIVSQVNEEKPKKRVVRKKTLRPAEKLPEVL
jgi:hypothetical protein